jgi:hypothetical protein
VSCCLYYIRFRDFRLKQLYLNNQNLWASGLYPSSGIPKNYKRLCFGNWIFFVFRCRRGTPTQLDPLERASLNHQKPLSFDYYSPSSEPFRIYFNSFYYCIQIIRFVFRSSSGGKYTSEINMLINTYTANREWKMEISHQETDGYRRQLIA